MNVPRRLREITVDAGIDATTALAGIDSGALLDGDAEGVATVAGREVEKLRRTQEDG